MRLSTATLGLLPASVEIPHYARDRIQAGIVHLGLDTFHRAHQAMFTDKVLAAGDNRWGILGAEVVSSALKTALAPQDGLYVLAERSAAGERLRVIGSLIGVLGGPEDADELLARMSSPMTRIVSLTVTEKGYCVDPLSGALDSNAVLADLAQPETPRTVPGLLVEALKRRRANGFQPFTVLSCDNLPHNGRRARTAVCAYAAELDRDLAAWVEANVSFPCTMVDRIAPATTDADRARIRARIGLEDQWPVVTEPFCQWVIEDDFTLGRPDWDKAGAIFSDEIDAWELMKLRCLNGAHSCLACLGQITGRDTVAAALASPLINATLEQLWREILATLKAPRNVDPAAYVENLRTRLANPALAHSTAQIAADSSQKLPPRLLAPLRERLERGLASPAILTALAAWFHLLVGAAHRAQRTLPDPLADTLLRCAGTPGVEDLVDSLLSIESVFGTDLAANIGLRFDLCAKYRELAMHPEVLAAQARR